MKSVFYDERINEGRGKAFRKTVWFAVLFTLAYTAAVVITDIACNRFIIFEITVQLITLFGGAVILLWGELAYIGASADEMKAHKKNLFFSYGFYGLVFVFAFAYCVHIAVNFRYVGMPESQPYGFYPAVMLECVGLYLMFCLKKEKVMLNYSQIERGANRYYLNVLFNILKFGGLCAAFTLFAAALFVVLGGELVSYFGLGVLLGGVGTWVILSAEYFLLSLMERASEKAGQKGKLSLTTVLSLAVAMLLSGCKAAVWLWLCCFEEINSAKTALFYSYFDLYTSWMLTMATAFFVMYLWSEAVFLSKIAKRSCERLIIVFIISHCYSISNMILKSLIGVSAFLSENEALKYAIANYTTFFIAAAFSVISLVCILPALKELGEKQLVPKGLPQFSVAYTCLHILMNFLNTHLLNSYFAMIDYVLIAVIYVFSVIFAFKLRNNTSFCSEI